MADAQILRQLGLDWLECRDEQGIFYFNQATQQSSDSIPAELLRGAVTPVAAPAMVAAVPAMSMPAMMAPASMSYQPPPTPTTMKAKVLSGGIQSLSHVPQPGTGQSLSCVPQPQQPQSYMPPQMQQVQSQSYLPPQMQQVQLIPQSQQLVYAQQQVYMQPQQSLSYTPMPQPQQQFLQPQQILQQPETAPAMQKMAFGDWAVYEDELGTFYMQVSSGVQFESPPPELMQAYQQYRAEQDQVHLQKLQQIELQKQQIDMQLAQQTQSLHMTYGIGGMPVPAA